MSEPRLMKDGALQLARMYFVDARVWVENRRCFLSDGARHFSGASWEDVLEQAGIPTTPDEEVEA